VEIAVEIDPLEALVENHVECNKRIPRCNNFYTVATTMKK
jgi:hypothetical protein